jgi:hypothetical protein
VIFLNKIYGAAMSSIVNYAGCQNPLFMEDMVKRIMFYVEPEENIKTTMLVCKTWHCYVAAIVKTQFISKTREELNAKMFSFFNMAGGTLDDYCPCLNEINDFKNKYSIGEVWRQLDNIIERKDTTRLVVGETISSLVDNIGHLQNLWWSIQQKANNENVYLDKSEYSRIKEMDVDERKKDICENKQIFIRLEHIGGQPWISGPEEMILLPIELFNVKVKLENNNLKIIPNKDEIDCCFCFNGRLFNVIISPCENKQPIDIYFGSYMPHACFIPRLDAGAPISFSVITRRIQEKEILKVASHQSLF